MANEKVEIPDSVQLEELYEQALEQIATLRTERDEARSQAVEFEHRSRDADRLEIENVKLIERIAKAEAALAQKTRECEEQERDWWVRLGKFRKALHEAGLHGHYNLLQEHFEDEAGQWERLVAERDELRTQVEQLGRQVAEMSEPVTEEEFDEYFHLQFGSSRDVATINEINALLASRARTK